MKTKRYISIILLSLFFLANEKANAQSPDWLWVKGIGGTGYDGVQSIALGASGNVYTTGFFQGIVDFDPGTGTLNLTAAGQEDIFISKLDSSGNFIWAKRIGGPGYDFGYSIALDPSGSGDVYITGTFRGTVDFNPGAGTFNLISNGQDDIFISKLDNAGNFVWAKRMGGTSTDGGQSIVLDPAGSGDVYSTGFFEGTVDFDPGAGTFNLTSVGIVDIFISRLDTSGNFVWAKAMGGTSNSESNSIFIDAAGNIYTTGPFDGIGDFDPGFGTFNLTSVGYSDIFITKLYPTGNFAWAKRMGGVGDDFSYSIAIDTSCNVYTTGYFEGAADFDPGPGIFNLTSVGGSPDIFISKLDSSGNFIWAKRMGGTGNDYSWSLALDPAGSGDVYTTGFFYGTADFNPDSSGNFNITTAGNSDIFISKLDASGNFVWAKSTGGANDDEGLSIALDASGNVHVAGYFSSPSVSFGSTTLTNADITGNTYDIFIAKLDTTIITGNDELKYFGIGISIFPNPATDLITVISSGQNEFVLQILNYLGQVVFENNITARQTQIDVSRFAAGMYLVKMSSEKMNETKKLLLIK